MNFLDRVGNLFTSGAETALSLRVQREQAEIARESREGSLENANPATKDHYPSGVTSTGLPIHFTGRGSLAVGAVFFMFMVILAIALISRSK